jgi:hypothetical protein
MAKLKLDKEALQSFFFNHTEKIVLGAVLLSLGLFIWTGSSLEGIGAQKNPEELSSNVATVAKKIEQPTWDNIKENFVPTLDHMVRKGEGDAPTSASYYPLETPLIGATPNSAIPRLDPGLFAPIDAEATIITGALAFKARENLVDPFADLENMEQETIEAPKKKTRKKKKNRRGRGNGGEGMEDMMSGMSGEGSEDDDEEGMFGAMSGMMGMSDMGAMAGAGGPIVRADATKFNGYRPTATASATGGSSVVGWPVNVVAVKALVPYQQQWDEFQRVFASASGYRPSRDVPRYLSFYAQRAEVPSDPSQPLTWGQKSYISSTASVLASLPKMGLAGFPGEIADSKYVMGGVLTMPVPPIMMRDLRPLALHSKVPMQKVAKATTIERTGPVLMDLDDLGQSTDASAIPTTPTAQQPRPSQAGMMGAGMMSGGGMEGMMSGMSGMSGMDDEGMGDEGMMSGMGGMEGMMGGASAQMVRGPQAEFLMVRFFDYSIKAGKKYVYRIQVVMEDPNHPQNPQNAPADRSLADAVRTRLVSVAADEAKQSAEHSTPVRLFTLKSEWSEPTNPVSIERLSDTFAGGVTQPPRRLNIPNRGSTNPKSKSGYSVPADKDATAEVMSLAWSRDFAIDLPVILQASRGALMRKMIKTNIIDPVTLVFKTLPEHQLTTGELVVDFRGGEVLEAAKEKDAKPLLTPGEVAVIDASGNFIVRNELDDWQIFDKYAPPPPTVVGAAASGDAGMGDEDMMGMGGMSEMMEE